jgi:hypothetical protein
MVCPSTESITTGYDAIIIGLGDERPHEQRLLLVLHVRLHLKPFLDVVVLLRGGTYLCSSIVHGLSFSRLQR